MSNDTGAKREYDIFLSYAGEDRSTIAQQIVRNIRAVGLSIWYDEIDSPLYKSEPHSPGDIARMLHSAMSRCKETWLLIGPAYANKKWTKYEAHSIAALLACELTQAGVIYHGMTQEDACAVASRFGLSEALNASNIIEYAKNANEITSRLLASFAPRVNGSMRKVIGPVDIVLFRSLGQVFLFTEGRLGAEGKIYCHDFCGTDITSGTNVVGIIKTHLGRQIIVGESVSIDGASIARTITDDGEVVLMLLNHPGQQIDSAEQIEYGVIRNFGSLIFIPSLTHGPVTIGKITERIPKFVEECIRSSGSVHHGRWKALYFSEDGKSFSVLTDGDE